MRDVLIQQRAFVQHWLDDIAVGLTPTRKSLEAALAALETHLTQGALAVDTIEESYMVWVSLVMSTGRDGRTEMTAYETWAAKVAAELEPSGVEFDEFEAALAFANGASVRRFVDDAVWAAGFRWADGGNEASATRNSFDA